MPAAKCGGCAKYLSPLGAAACSVCRALFHRACGSLPSSGPITPSWSCTDCTRKSLRGVTGNATPIADRINEEVGVSLSLDGKLDSDVLNALDSFRAELRGELRQMFREEFVLVKKEFLDELQTLRQDFVGLRRDSDRLKETVTSLKEQLGALDTRLSSIEQSCNISSESVDEIAQIKLQLNDRDQQLLSNDLEISNLTESSNESLIHVVKLIGSKLGVHIEDTDIVSADRVGGRRINVTSAAGATETRPRPIAVRLVRRDLRDELLRAARVRRGANTGDLNMPGQPRNFFLNERLTKFNRQLFRRAREAGQRLGWKYVWTKYGRILARHNGDDKVSIIRNEADLSRIFGLDA